MNPTLLFLTCSDKKEAKAITDVLLKQRLVACVKWFPVSTHFLWEDKKESDEEVMLIMETVEQKYDSIVNCINKLHSYDTFVLQAVPVTKISEDVQSWLAKELRI